MYIGDAPTAHTHLLAAGATDVTATAAEVNTLDGITATTTELNYTDGVTSAIQTQLDAAMLAGALISVLEGGPESALDEYSVTRRDYHKNMVQQKAAKNYSDLVLTEAEDRAKRNEAMKAMAKDPEQARAYLLRASMLDHRIERSNAA